jgi:ABC-type Fe3+-hydroxamate transport system substrate-binding protein
MDDLRPYYVELDAPVQFPPRRVVSLVPAMTESLFDLGLGARVAGVTALCVRPAEVIGRVPTVGMPGAVDMERVMSLRPELVIASADENDAAQIEAMQRMGLAVWVTKPRSVRDMFNLLWNIMHVFDEGKFVERVRAIEWTCDWLERLSAQREPVSAFVALSSDPLRTCAPNTYMSDLLRICGAATVPAVLPPGGDSLDALYPALDWDQVAECRPAVVLLPMVDVDRYAVPADAALSASIPARWHDHVKVLDEALLTWAGTRVAQAFQVLPGLLGTSEAM